MESIIVDVDYGLWHRPCYNFIHCRVLNFRYQGNNGRSEKNLEDTVKLADIENHRFGARICVSQLPKYWNALPPHILQFQTLSSFRHRLKTHYFQPAYPAP